MPMGPGEEDTPFLHENDDELGHRPNDQENPSQWDQHRINPNQDLVDMPQRIEDPTDIDWMD